MEREQSVHGTERARELAAMMRSARWRESLMAEHAKLQSRLRDAIDGDDQCEEAV